ncbi:MAG: diaminopimelate decarboxylase [Pseudobdellovibrionaceae bacterium]
MSKLEYNSSGELELDGVRLSSLTKEGDEPAYVYSRKGLLDRLSLFQSHLARVLTQRYSVHYAMKANPHPEILKLFKTQNIGVDIVSGGELRRALEVGFQGGQIIFSGVAKSQNEIQQCLKAGIRQFNIECASELRRIGEVSIAAGKKVSVVFRINPDVNPKTHRYISTGFRENKFGMEQTQLAQCFEILKQFPHLQLNGVSSHIGSQLMEFGAVSEALKLQRQVFEKWKSQGFPMQTFDVGGGLGIDYTLDASSDTQWIEGYCQVLKEELAGLEAQIQLEPGRFLVARSGALLTQVQYLKKTPDKNFLICNSGMHHLIRPALYEAYHRILPLQQRAGEELMADVVGPVCESSDFLGKDRKFQGIKEGDWLLVADAGAYGASMANQYNLFSPPREIIF